MILSFLGICVHLCFALLDPGQIDSPSLYKRAFLFFWVRLDKDFGLISSISVCSILT